MTISFIFNIGYFYFYFEFIILNFSIYVLFGIILNQKY